MYLIFFISARKKLNSTPIRETTLLCSVDQQASCQSVRHLRPAIVKSRRNLELKIWAYSTDENPSETLAVLDEAQKNHFSYDQFQPLYQYAIEANTEKVQCQ